MAAPTARSRLQPRQTQLMQPAADRALMHRHRKPPHHLGLKIHAPPPHHLVDLRIGTRDHQRPQLRHLPLAQDRRPTRAQARLQTLHALGVVAMHPVAQRLTIHPVQRRRLRPRMTLKHQRQRQQPPNLRPIRTPAAQRPQLHARVVPPRNPQRRAHPISPLSESAHRIAKQPPWESSTSQPMRGLV